MYSYIVYYCILIVFCIVGLRVLHGLINLDESINQSINLSDERNFVPYSCQLHVLAFFYMGYSRDVKTQFRCSTVYKQVVLSFNTPRYIRYIHHVF